MDQLLELIHGTRAVLFIGLAIVHVWDWRRSGYWMPRYIHAIALGAFLVGCGISATLPPATNPNVIVQRTYLLIFPTIGVIATYSIAILFGFLHTLNFHAATAINKVRIVGIPPGEAPSDIRRAWVGLILPLAPGEHYPRYRTPDRWELDAWIARSWKYLTTWRTPDMVYLVQVDEAIEVLERVSPDAASWFRSSRPDWLGQGKVFLFPATVCEPVHQPH